MVRLHRPTLPSLSLLYYHPHSNDRPPNRATLLSLSLSLSLSFLPASPVSLSLSASLFFPTDARSLLLSLNPFPRPTLAEPCFLRLAKKGQERVRWSPSLALLSLSIPLNTVLRRVYGWFYADREHKNEKSDAYSPAKNPCDPCNGELFFSKRSVIEKSVVKNASIFNFVEFFAWISF